MWSAVGVGMLLGSLVTTLSIKLIPHDLLYTIGWRLPFLFGLITGIIGSYFRKKIPEAALFSEIQKHGQISQLSTTKVIKTHKKSLAIIIGLYALSSVITYIVFVFMPIYASSTLNIPLDKASLITTIALACSTIAVPFIGLLSDKIGRKPCLYLGAINFLLLSYPLYSFMLIHQSMFSFICAESIFVLISISYQGALTSAAQELPMTAVRYTITAIGYNVSYALFGGTAPFVITYLANVFQSQLIPGIYLSIMGMIAIIAIYNMKESYRKVL